MVYYLQAAVRRAAEADGAGEAADGSSVEQTETTYRQTSLHAGTQEPPLESHLVVFQRFFVVMNRFLVY